ncbi:MAG: AroM family protein [Acetobacteraceae bacterium]
MPKRAMFVTIGQSPRPDIMPELLAAARTPLGAEECGVLDGLDEREIAGMSVRNGAALLVSRLRDGQEVVLDHRAVESRLVTLLGELDRSGYDLIVLLCSGRFRKFALVTPFIEPEHVLDHFAQGLAYGAQRIGVMLPHREQIADFSPLPGLAARFDVVSPYAGAGEERFRAAGRALKDTGLIVMHCMGYTEAMRRSVMKEAKRPVLLPRRVVAHAIDLILS